MRWEILYSLEEKEALLLQTLYKKSVSVEVKEDIFSTYIPKAANIIQKYKRNYIYLAAAEIQLQIGDRENFLTLETLYKNLINPRLTYKTLSEVYREEYNTLKSLLEKGISHGINPKVIGREISKQLDMSLYKSIRIARTEQMNAFRDTQRLQMMSSGVVSHWEWLAEPNACDICKENHGKRFSLSEKMDTHPNCRCAMLPVV